MLTQKVRLKLAIAEHPHTSAIRNGSIPIEGVDAEFVTVQPQIGAFRRMVRDVEFDVCELAPTTYIIARAYGAPFVGLPIFVVRRFHHGGLLVRPDAGIKTPRDLEGKKVGVRAYSVTTGVWTRQVLIDEFGLDSSKVTWVVDDEEHGRAYIVRNGEIRQISEDHSLVASLVRSGAMSPSEAAQSPERNVILQALGTRFDIEPQIWDRGLPLQTGDALILCTDGLTDLVDEVAIATIVATTAPFEACQALIDAALAAGGHDNISVGVFSVADEPKAPDAERPTRTTDLRALAGEPP